MRKRKLSSLGLIIKHRLSELNMTQRELARLVGSSEAYIYLITTGDRSGNKYLDSIGEVLNIDLKKKHI
ncbi:helix-turn-helix domain-containing protein [Lutispora saccharofermentans]|uniref:Helix-turn-helix domain-containing protein n=1 Tax=Lutispora saccharofermentans TaxID=3024236 RepID=A0ABT1NKV3_9FIRM|nr:helix-turn-helix domain-containing protein [Lutispora saccharofermentans]